MKPFSLEAYQLMHDGALTLAQVEANGIRVDVEYFQRQDQELAERLTDLERVLWRMPEAREWKGRYKEKTNFNSPTQLSTMLFKVWGHKPTKETRRGNAAVDDEALRRVGSKFTETLQTVRKLQKAKNTYIAQMLRCQTDGYLHPSFNLHLVQTYRSSSDGPNFQNIPVRDPEQGLIIRGGIIPRDRRRVIGEVDFSGIEVRVAACYHKDPTMLTYIKDPTKDMHRDMAAECYLLEPTQVGKKIRYMGKSGFVFPAFYGSYHAQIAPAMWKGIQEHKLVTEDGVPLGEHLRAKGIKTLERFTDHIEKVERNFWDDRFPVYARWKREHYAQYLRRGWFDLLTGFRCQGPMRRNEVCNYPVQGAAFHCLLWSLIQLQRWMDEKRLESRIIGQIHDSIILDMAEDEVPQLLRKVKRVMTEEIREHWKWINVPLDVEAELAPPGRPWSEKKTWEIK